MNEILNLEHHYKVNTLKALNKTATIPDAAKLLGVSSRTVHFWKQKFGIYLDKKENQFKVK